MQRLFFKKLIDLNHHLQELTAIQVNENLAYLDDPAGKRAIGSLEISGEYLRLATKERFNDQIDIDVLAPFDRLEDNEEFHLAIQDYDYHIQNGNLEVEIQVLAYGVGEKKERHIEVVEPSVNEQEMLKEIQNIVDTNVISPKEENISLNRAEDILDSEGDESLAVEAVDMEDLFDDEDLSYVTYPIYVVKKEDTYASIAKKYGVDEQQLRAFNHDVDLTDHQLLSIPPK